MSTSVRKLTRPIAESSVTAENASRLDMLKLRNGLIFHADATAAITTPDAVSGDGYVTSVALVNACSAAYTAHIASACDAVTGVGCHISADATNVISAPVATDFASAETLANQLKAQFNLHRASAVFHPVADSTNNVSAADATTDASLATLVTQIKAKLNAHFAAAFSSQAIVYVAP